MFVLFVPSFREQSRLRGEKNVQRKRSITFNKLSAAFQKTARMMVSEHSYRCWEWVICQSLVDIVECSGYEEKEARRFATRKQFFSGVSYGSRCFRSYLFCLLVIYLRLSLDISKVCLVIWVKPLYVLALWVCIPGTNP